MIDTYSALQKLLGEPLFYDQVHLTPHGNARLAEAVADAIEPMIDTLESD
jgi:lysophospholipase L1-like esterase